MSDVAGAKAEPAGLTKDCRPVYWLIRILATARPEWSKLHLFPPGSRVALCGRSIPREITPDSNRWVDAGPAGTSPAGQCERCRKIAGKDA